MLSAMASADNCLSPKELSVPSTVTKADLNASVMSAQPSKSSLMHAFKVASAQCLSKMFSKDGYESCFSVVV